MNYPHDLVRIWAKNSDDQWLLLWHKDIYAEYNRDLRQFLPPLQSYAFKTKMLRLEFQNIILSSDWIQLDAVLLIGTSELILPKSPKQDLTYLLKNIRYSNMDVLNLTPHNIFDHMDIYYLQQKFRECCIISKRYNSHEF
jgi:hypothetical protein